MPKARNISGLLILSIFFISLFVVLGSWQIMRGLEKRRITKMIEEQSLLKPSTVELPIMSLQDWNFRPVAITGRYLSQYQFLLDNQVRDGRVGYNVLSIFRQDGSGENLLIDRGWIAAGGNRNELPAVSVDDRQHTAFGHVYVSREKPYSLGPIDEGEGETWPRRIQFLDLLLLEELSGFKLQPFVLRLSPEAPHGYRRDWPLNIFPAEKHFAYAFQWYALAVTISVLLVVYMKSKFAR